MGEKSEPAVDDDFVRAHEHLVHKQARRVKAQFELKTEIEDLIAYGMQGLLEARERFDPSRGVQFKHFAYYRIRGAIVDGVRQMAYLPRRAHQLRRAAETLDRAAEETALARAKTPEARRDAAKTLAAVDDILGKTCAAFVIDAVGQSAPSEDAESEVIASEERARVLQALEVLGERERRVVEEYYLTGRTLDDIGLELGVGKSWVSRICSRALVKMRVVLEEPERR